ncbi:hypothetical protein GGR54DRAFT_85000 [Hypoxylon sp. NC1633]|nr:hypothetical protein GGR54DRAFT_85000 [Hypoxylon sp. NC1633]
MSGNDFQLALKPLSVPYSVLHERFMHAVPERISIACRRAGIPINTREAATYTCEACLSGTAHRLYNKLKSTPAHRPFQLLTFDLIEHENGFRGYKYAIYAIDDYSRYHYIKFTPNKDELNVGPACREMILEIERQSLISVQMIQLNGGTEFKGTTR